MSGKTAETALWAWLRSGKAYYKDDLDIMRVENSARSGTPDVEGYIAGLGQFWIELKTVARTNILRVKFRPNQPPWLSRRAKLGCHCYVLIQVGGATKAARYLIHGRDVNRIMGPVTERELHSLSLCEADASPAAILAKAASSP